MPSKIGTCQGCGKERALRAKRRCATCNNRASRTRSAAVKAVLDSPAVQRSLATNAVMAQEILGDALPTAARSLVRAIEVAGEKGDSRPAQALLSRLPIDAEGNRILASEQPQQQVATGGGMKIYIGVALGGNKALQPTTEERQAALTEFIGGRPVETLSPKPRFDPYRPPSTFVNLND